MAAREFGPLVAECVKRGISRSTAYVLLNQGLVETFAIGAKRYVYIDSLLTLGERINRYVQPKEAN